MENETKSAATLTIKEADRMTEDGRKEVADWLRAQADSLEEGGHDYAARFRARYMFRDGDHG